MHQVTKANYKSKPVQVAGVARQQTASAWPGFQGLSDLCAYGLATLAANYCLQTLKVCKPCNAEMLVLPYFFVL